MSRLIDADRFKRFLQALCKAGAPYHEVIQLLDKEPTAYDVDKVVAKLEEEKQRLRNLKNDCVALSDHEVIAIEEGAYNFCKNIVNELAEEYNNGWIPCSERLPSEDGKYLVTVKNLTGYWILKNNVFVCDYQCGDFIFQGWEDNAVIAWQPLPEPYKEGGETDE